jgi:hypothetical protein
MGLVQLMLTPRLEASAQTRKVSFQAIPQKSVDLHSHSLIANQKTDIPHGFTMAVS